MIKSVKFAYTSGNKENPSVPTANFHQIPKDSFKPRITQNSRTNSVNHKTKQSDMDMRKRLGGRRSRRRKEDVDVKNGQYPVGHV